MAKTKDPSEGQILINISGPLAVDGRVPFSVLVKKLGAVQRSLFNIGTALIGGGRKGAWRSQVTQACELQFVTAEKGSLQIVAEVPSKLTLPQEIPTLGLDTLRNFSESLDAISRNDGKKLKELYPDYTQRIRILKSFSPLLPEEDSDYDLEIGTKSGRVKLESNLKEYIELLANEQEPTIEEAFRTFTGTLYKIQVGVGEREIGVLSNNRKLKCYYSEEYEDIIRELVPGSLVEVEGTATFDARGDVEAIQDISDVKSISLTPLHWKRIYTDERKFDLNEPIQVKMDFQDGIWVLENESLKIFAYSPNRSDAIKHFKNDFIAAWDFIAQDDDDNLTLDAILLKKALKKLVKSESKA